MKDEHATRLSGLVLRILVTGLLTSSLLRLWHQADLSVTCRDRDMVFARDPGRTSEERHTWAVRAQVQSWTWSNWWVPAIQAIILACWRKTDTGLKQMLYILLMVAAGLIGNWDLMRGLCDNSGKCSDPRFDLAANNCNYPADEKLGLDTDKVSTSCTLCDQVVYSMNSAGAIMGALATTALVFVVDL